MILVGIQSWAPQVVQQQGSDPDDLGSALRLGAQLCRFTATSQPILSNLTGWLLTFRGDRRLAPGCPAFASADEARLAKGGNGRGCHSWVCSFSQQRYEARAGVRDTGFTISVERYN